VEKLYLLQERYGERERESQREVEREMKREEKTAKEWRKKERRKGGRMKQDAMKIALVCQRFFSLVKPIVEKLYLLQERYGKWKGERKRDEKRRKDLKSEEKKEGAKERRENETRCIPVILFFSQIKRGKAILTPREVGKRKREWKRERDKRKRERHSKRVKKERKEGGKERREKEARCQENRTCVPAAFFFSQTNCGKVAGGMGRERGGKEGKR
jgi:hypothetical protein